jgi:acetyltransferase-like isoleucine patch superfamily enzyme
MYKIFHLILYQNLKIFRSIYFSILLNGLNRKMGLLLFGKITVNISKSSKINCINNCKLYLNKPMRKREPFVGMLEMYEDSSLIVKNDFTIHSGAHIIIARGAVLKLGSGYVNRNCKIKCFSEVEIGNDVAISENVTIWDSDVHEIKGSTLNTKPIKIGNHVWIGTNCIILKGVSVGDGAVIGAGSIVNKDIPPNCLAVGNPAKVIKQNVEWV